MKRTILIAAALLGLGGGLLRADQTIAEVQQSLKDAGFYYGPVDGSKNADTTAAIRRYQIRNGLKITGDVDAETLKALGSTATPPPPPPPTVASTPADTSDLRAPATPAPAAPARAYNLPHPPTAPVVQANPRPTTGGIFGRTPYETAPPEVQHRVIIGAQTLLSRRGYYGGDVDGLFGPGTESALRLFQSRNGIPPSGRLDMDTLAALGLLPGERAPGFAIPARRAYPGPVYRSAPPTVYRGEWIQN